MKILNDKLARFEAICPHCDSELEVTEGDQQENLYTFEKELSCPCCGRVDRWDKFVIGMM